jgi:hypothetical protein
LNRQARSGCYPVSPIMSRRVQSGSSE